jgi:serine/threonine protein kinase
MYLGVNSITGDEYAIERLRLVELARTGDARFVEVLHAPAVNEVYLVLEYADNGSVGDLIEQSHQLPVPSVTSIIKQIAGDLKHLHDSGYVHQDIKLSNIMLTKSGRAVLADFGIGHSFLSSAMVVGSPAYQAPGALDDSYADESESEPEPGAGTQKEDVWALGMTLYQMLFRELPFVGNNLDEIVSAIRVSAFKIPEGTDPLIVNFLQGMINVDPVKRFSIEEVLDHPLVRNADPFASDLLTAPSAERRTGEVKPFRAELCPEGASFAGIALTIKRRSSLQQYGVSRSTDAIPRASPNLKTTTRSSDSELQNHEFCYLARRLAEDEPIHFT